MPLVSNELGTQYYEPVASGPCAQADLSAWGPTTPPGTINGSANWTSSVAPGDGFKMVSAAVTLSQAGTISIQRYLDAAGTIAQGAPVSTTLTAATPAVVNINDGLPFRTFTVKIANTSGSTGAVSNYALLLSA